jgi:hypothetical protein
MDVDFQAVKDRAIKRAMRDAAATYIDLLIGQVKDKIPDAQTFTKAELIELLTGMAEGMRGDNT